jgi:hypothetical protein
MESLFNYLNERFIFLEQGLTQSQLDLLKIFHQLYEKLENVLESLDSKINLKLNEERKNLLKDIEKINLNSINLVNNFKVNQVDSYKSLHSKYVSFDLEIKKQINCLAKKMFFKSKCVIANLL